MSEFVIGFVIGAIICLAKEFLFQRFILRGNKFFAMLLFWARLLIDFAVLVAMYCYALCGYSHRSNPQAGAIS